MAIIGDPITDMLLERCEEHGWRGSVLGCPKCREQRENADKMLREQRELTRLTRERNEKDEAERRKRDVDAEYARSIQSRQRWEDERSRQQQRRQEQEREQQRIMQEEAEKLAREEELIARRYELDRLKSCPYCGQRYDGETCKLPSVGFHWIGMLGRHSAHGVCPRCYHDRLEKGEEVPWIESDWQKYLLANLNSDSNINQMKEIYDSIKSINYPHLIEKVINRLIEAYIKTIEVIKTEIIRTNSMTEFDRHISIIEQIEQNILSISDKLSQNYWKDLEEFLRERREQIQREERRQHQIKKIEERHIVAKQNREAALNRLRKAEYDLQQSNNDFRQNMIRAIKDGLFFFLIFGFLGALCGGCYGCLALNGKMTDTSFYFGGISAFIALILSVSYEYGYGIIRAAMSSVTNSQIALDDARLHWCMYESKGIENSLSSKLKNDHLNARTLSLIDQKKQLLMIVKYMGIVALILSIACIWAIFKSH